MSRASSTANIRNQSLGSKNKVCDVQKKPGFSAHCHLTSQIVEDSRVWVLSSDMPPSRSTCPMSSSHPLPQKEPSVLTTLVFSGLLTASNTSSCPRQEWALQPPPYTWLNSCRSQLKGHSFGEAFPNDQTESNPSLLLPTPTECSRSAFPGSSVILLAHLLCSTLQSIRLHTVIVVVWLTIGLMSIFLTTISRQDLRPFWPWIADVWLMDSESYLPWSLMSSLPITPFYCHTFTHSF